MNGFFTVYGNLRISMFIVYSFSVSVFILWLAVQKDYSGKIWLFFGLFFKRIVLSTIGFVPNKKSKEIDLFTEIKKTLKTASTSVPALKIILSASLICKECKIKILRIVGLCLDYGI